MTTSLLAIGDRAVKCSDAPITVDGVKYQPKWEWTEDFRKCWRQTYGRGKSALSEADREVAYLSWLAKKRGLESAYLAKKYLVESGQMVG